MTQHESFVKACKAFFEPPAVSISEFKDLTTQDKLELSEMLNAAGFEHPPYQPIKVGAAAA